MQRRINVFMLLMILLAAVPLAQAQDALSSVCVLAFEDANENSVRDAGEVPLPGISVHLAVNTDVIVRTYITTEDNRPHCFEELEPGVYNIYFASSVNHRATTQNSAALAIEGNQRIRVEFGAVSESPFRDADSPIVSADREDAQLAPSTRLLIAALGAVFVMIFMLGLGILIASIIY